MPSLIDGIRRPWQSGQSGQVRPAPLMRVQLPRTTVSRATRSVASAEAQTLSSDPQRNSVRRPGNDNGCWSHYSSRPEAAVRRAKRTAVKRWSALAGLALGLLVLVGCREVRVKTLATGTTTVPGGNQILIVRDAVALGKLGIHAPVHFKGEFGVVLLMGPHDRTGYKQIVESISANPQRVRVVAFEQAPADARRTFGPIPYLYALDRSEHVYRRGVRVEVVTPSDEPIATTYLAVGVAVLSPKTFPRRLRSASNELARARRTARPRARARRRATEAGGILNPAAARAPQRRAAALSALRRRRQHLARRDACAPQQEPTGFACERLDFALEPQAPYELRPHRGYGCEDPRVTYVPVLEAT